VNCPQVAHKNGTDPKDADHNKDYVLMCTKMLPDLEKNLNYDSVFYHYADGSDSTLMTLFAITGLFRISSIFILAFKGGCF